MGVTVRPGATLRRMPIDRPRRWPALLWLLAAAALPARGEVDAWAGDYIGVGGAVSRMQITPAGDGRFEILWTGGGDDRAGAATAADCTALALALPTTGEPKAPALRAELQPFRRGDAELDAADLAVLKPGPIMLASLAAEPARLVRVDGVFVHCGLQAGHGGTYWRPAAAADAPHPLSPVFRRCTAPAAVCLAAEHGRQDQRLNQAYQAVLGHFGAGVRGALRQAQRRWLAERDQRCGRVAERLACLAHASAHRADELAALERTVSLEATGRSR